MGPDNEQNLNIETQQKIRVNLDRFMQSRGLAEARDIVTEDPLLLGTHVADYLSEAIKRFRQLGDVEFANKCEFWLGLLRTFREFGIQGGYLELAIDELVRTPTSEDERAILRDNPELISESAAAFIKRRHRESVDIADTTAESKYRLAWTLISGKSINGLDTEDTGAGLTNNIIGPNAEDTVAAEARNWRTISSVEGIGMSEAVNAFLAEFILEPDFAVQRSLLESRPDLLQSPRSLLVGAMFQPYIERARAGLQLVTLRDLLLRQALFARCQEVGISRAFEEMARGVKWKQLSSK